MPRFHDFFRKHNAHDANSESYNELLPSSPKGIKKDAASVHSSGGISIPSLHSITESTTSFYSALDGSRIPKRRRAEVSRLGVPKCYRSDPPPPKDMEGTERVTLESLGDFIAAHAKSLSHSDARPWLSVIVYNYAAPQSRLPRYFNDARVQGEVRMLLTKPTNVASIDIWLFAKAESDLEIVAAPFVQCHANLWNRSKGLPSEDTITSAAIVGFKGKLPSGSYVFPFEFSPLPLDVQVRLGAETVEREGSARVFLPPTSATHLVGGFNGQTTYAVGVDVKHDGMGSVDNSLDLAFDYYPRARPLPRETVPFPFIPTREDWPFHREVVGGWTLTPFGVRGHSRDEKIEVEGILGVQTPEVYAPGQTAIFGLLLWSTSSAALQALGHPDSFDVAFVRSDMYGPDVLRPRNSARSNRNLVRLSQGRIWRTDDGSSSDEKIPELRPEFPSSKVHEVENVIRLDGDVHVTHALPPSFRYKYIGCEYIIAITITHPDFTDISPSGPGIQTETPLWVVTDAPNAHAAKHADNGGDATRGDPHALPITGEVVEVGAGTIRSQRALGEPTSKQRPSGQTMRMSVF